MLVYNKHSLFNVQSVNIKVSAHSLYLWQCQRSRERRDGSLAAPAHPSLSFWCYWQTYTTSFTSFLLFVLLVLLLQGLGSV